MTDAEIADLCNRMVSSALEHASRDATPGQLAAGGFCFLLELGVPVTATTASCVGLVIDTVLEIRAEQRARVGAAQA